MNASCYQYNPDACPPLPYTGFDLLDWFAVGALLLAAGLYLWIKLATILDHYEAADDTEG